MPTDASDDPSTDAGGGPAVPGRHIARRTSQLPLVSKVLYRIDHYTSLPVVDLTVVALLVGMLVVGAVLGFSPAWVIGFEVSVGTLTLLMVFTIQHTQSREQAATQRKLDELLRALPGAAESLMMLEEAPKEFILEVEEEQREARSDSVDDRPADGAVEPGGHDG